MPEYTIDKDKLSHRLIGRVKNTKRITRKAQLEAFDHISAARPVVGKILSEYAAVLTPSVPEEASIGL